MDCLIYRKLLQFCVLTIQTLDDSICNLNKQSKTWIHEKRSTIWIAFQQSNIWMAFEPSNNWMAGTKNQMFQFDCIWSRFWIQQAQILIIVELEKMAFFTFLGQYYYLLTLFEYLIYILTSSFDFVVIPIDLWHFL